MESAESRPLFRVFATVEIVNIVLSIITNLIVVYFTIAKSSKEFGSYRYLLFAFALNDIMFPVVHFLTLPVICTYLDAFLMFSNGILTSKFSICLFASVFSQAMPLLAHLFIFRLIATTNPSLLSFYTKRNTFVAVTSTVIIQNILWFTNCYINQNSDEETRAYLQPFFDSEFYGKGEGHIASYYFNEAGLRVQAFIGTMVLNTIMIFWISIISYCTVVIVKRLSAQNAEWSEKTRALQRTMFKTLFVQMVIPLTVVYLPCAGIINTAIFGFRVNIFPNLVSAALTLFPVLDAMVIIFGVKSYRHIVLAVVRCKGIENNISTSGVMSVVIKQEKITSTVHT